MFITHDHGHRDGSRSQHLGNLDGREASADHGSMLHANDVLLE